MTFISLFRIIKLGINNFWRHRWLTLGATLLMTLTLTMISVFMILNLLVNNSVDKVREKIDVSIYFRDDKIADQTILDFKEKLLSIASVKEVNFVSKQNALEIFGRLPLDKKIKDPITTDNNPLPRSLNIKTTNPEAIPALVDTIASIDTTDLVCDDCVSYNKNKENVQKLSTITKFVQRAGLILSLFFILIAIFNVFNIIRISIRARADEITIMRYVGASTGFVQGPFIVEGAMYGVLGTLFTTVAILIVSYFAGPYVNGAFAIFQINLFKFVTSNIWGLIELQLLVGVVLGIVVSLFSIRRYLKL